MQLLCYSVLYVYLQRLDKLVLLVIHHELEVAVINNSVHTSNRS